MKKIGAFISVLVLAGCSDTKLYQPDNTARNRSDEHSAQSQLENATDIRIIQNIRKKMMENDSLSVYAKNAKIISEHGHVVIKGPVNTETEKSQIEEIAKAEKDVKSVENQLIVLKK